MVGTDFLVTAFPPSVVGGAVAAEQPFTAIAAGKFTPSDKSTGILELQYTGIIIIMKYRTMLKTLPWMMM